MKSVKKIIITLVIFTTVNLMNAAAVSQVELDNQLIEAAQNNDRIQAVTDLLNRDANVNARDYQQHTPLHCAVINNNIEVARELLKRGANVNAANQLGWTPLHYAAAYNNLAMINLLLNHGANTTLTNARGKTAKDFATQGAIVEILQDWEDAPIVKGVMEEGL